MNNTILWWGRSDINYSRNRIIINLLKELGHQIIFFNPTISLLGHYEAIIKVKVTPNLVWVPCFRHRDINSAFIWCKKNNVPLIFDPLISSWDKIINEKKYFKKNSKKSIKLKIKERDILKKADLIIADTEAHKKFFIQNFNVPKNKVEVVFVGAESKSFKPLKKNNRIKKEILFYGSFLKLHGIETLIKASNICENNNLKWTFIGSKEKFKGYINSQKINIEDTIKYELLPQRIANADILLGIFGKSQKANNVIPNKVYQSLACGKPVITRYANSYPKKVLEKKNSGIFFVDPNKPQQIIEVINKLFSSEQFLKKSGINARKTYLQYFSDRILKNQLNKLFIKLKI